MPKLSGTNPVEDVTIGAKNLRSAVTSLLAERVTDFHRKVDTVLSRIIDIDLTNALKMYSYLSDFMDLLKSPPSLEFNDSTNLLNSNATKYLEKIFCHSINILYLHYLMTGRRQTGPVDDKKLFEYYEFIFIDKEKYHLLYRYYSHQAPLQAMQDKINKTQSIFEQMELLPQNILSIYEDTKKEVENLKDSLEKVRDAAFEKLGIEFNKMEVEKKDQQKLGFIWVIAMGIACVLWPVVILISNGSMSLMSLLQYWLGNLPEPPSTSPIGVVSFLAVEILLIYFFRIALHNFYAIRDQILAIRTRRALCQFVPTYLEFSKYNESEALDVFASHIFSEIPARLQKIPATFDLAGQVASAIKNCKSP